MWDNTGLTEAVEYAEDPSIRSQRGPSPYASSENGWPLSEGSEGI